MCDFDGATRVVGLLAPLAKSIWVITTFALVVLKVLLKNYLCVDLESKNFVLKK